MEFWKILIGFWVPWLLATALGPNTGIGLALCFSAVLWLVGWLAYGTSRKDPDLMEHWKAHVCYIVGASIATVSFYALLW